MPSCKSCKHYMGNYFCSSCMRDMVRGDSRSGYKCYSCGTRYERPKFLCAKCGGAEEKEGCYVATCVYCSYESPEVWTLRRFRDHTLSRSFVGRAFIRAYYAVSPPIIRYAGGKQWFHSLCKPLLNKAVRGLQSRGVSGEPYNEREQIHYSREMESLSEKRTSLSVYALHGKHRRQSKHKRKD